MRLERLLGNWFFILTSPIWVLPVFVVVAIQAAWDRDRNPEVFNAVTGRSWIV